MNDCCSDHMPLKKATYSRPGVRICLFIGCVIVCAALELTIERSDVSLFIPQTSRGKWRVWTMTLFHFLLTLILFNLFYLLAIILSNFLLALTLFHNSLCKYPNNDSVIKILVVELK